MLTEIREKVPYFQKLFLSFLIAAVMVLLTTGLAIPNSSAISYWVSPL